MTKQTVTNSNRLVEGHGYFRTLKGVGLVCAVVIAGALATGQANADQVLHLLYLPYLLSLKE